MHHAMQTCNYLSMRRVRLHKLVLACVHRQHANVVQPHCSCVWVNHNRRRAVFNHTLLVCSLSVSAEPFGSPPQPVPLDLLTLPRGLTALELRNVDIITPPTEFGQPPHLASRQSGEGRGGGGGQRGTWSRGAAAASTLHSARPHGIIALPAPPAAARLTPLLPPPEDAPVLALGALPAAVAQAAPPLQQPAVAPMPRAAGRATPPGVLAAPARRGCEDVADVLSQLCSLKLESCRLRLPQLQVSACYSHWHCCGLLYPMGI
jgi:hypothetical protein